MRTRGMLVLVMAAALVATILGSPASATESTSSSRADLILHSGKVWTGDRGEVVQAVAIAGDRFVAVGSDREVLRYADRRTRVIDLGGAFVAPGLRDQHTHLLEVARGARDAGGEPGDRQTYRPVFEAYDEAAAVEGRRQLGEAQLALHRAGGNPMDPCEHSPVTSELKRNLLVMQDEAARQGLSTVVEAGLKDLGVWDALRQLSREGRMKVRHLVRISAGCMDEAAALGLRTGSGDEWVKILGVKLYSDGWLGPRTAALRMPYSDDPFGFPRRGILFLDQREANSEAAKAKALGFNATAHAIGDRGVLTMLNAYRNAGVQPGDRWAIEHVQVAADDLLRRLKQSGVVASVQLSFATSDQRFAESALGADRLQDEGYRWRTMLERGVLLAGSSDYPVEVLDPMWGLQRVVTRREFDGAPPGGFMPEQRLSVPAALKLVTSAAAYASLEDGERGRIRAGNYADLVVVRENLLAMPRDCIATATRVMTITNGRVTSRGPVSYPPTGATCQSAP